MKNISSSERVRAKIGGGKIYSDELEVNKIISKWYILSPLFIALPNSLDFKPVMLTERYRKKAFTSNKKKSAFSVFYSLLFAIVSLFLFLSIDNEKFLNLALASLVLTIYFTIEHFTVSNNIRALTDRNILISNISIQYKGHAFRWLCIIISLGAIQTILNNYLGGFESVIYQYGGIYKSTITGEWWRIITASVFHSGLMHWLTNLALVLIAGPLYISLTGRNGLCTFSTGCIAGSLSALLLYILGFTTADAYTGISAGIYALLGYTALFTYKNKSIKTGKIFISITNFLFMSTALSLLLSASISNTAHISGFFTGGLLASFSNNKK